MLKFFLHIYFFLCCNIIVIFFSIFRQKNVALTFFALIFLYCANNFFALIFLVLNIFTMQKIWLIANPDLVITLLPLFFLLLLLALFPACWTFYLVILFWLFGHHFWTIGPLTLVFIPLLDHNVWSGLCKIHQAPLLTNGAPYLIDRAPYLTDQAP